MSTDLNTNLRGGVTNGNNYNYHEHEAPPKAKYVCHNNVQRPQHTYNLRSRTGNQTNQVDLNNNNLACANNKNNNTNVFHKCNGQMVDVVGKNKSKITTTTTIVTSNTSKRQPSDEITSTIDTTEFGNGGALKRGFDYVDAMDGDQDQDEDLAVLSSPLTMHLSRKSPPKKAKPLITYREMIEFFNLLKQESINEFLMRDACCLISDKYALAMVFMYFKRARLSLDEYTCYNFYLALYLASDIEEDVDEYKYEIFPWALGSKWRTKFSGFLRKRDALLRRIGYRAIVSRKCCEEVMNLVPDHYAWKRERSEDHGGATRAYLINRSRRFLSNKGAHEEDEINLPRGPTEKARPCPLCLINRSSLNINFGKFISPTNPTMRPSILTFSKINPQSSSMMPVGNFMQPPQAIVVPNAPPTLLVVAQPINHKQQDQRSHIPTCEPNLAVSIAIPNPNPNPIAIPIVDLPKNVLDESKVQEPKQVKTPPKKSSTSELTTDCNKNSDKENRLIAQDENVTLNVNISITNQNNNDRAGLCLGKSEIKYRNRSTEQPSATNVFMPVSPKLTSNLSKLNPAVKYPSLASVNYLYVKDQVTTSDEYDEDEDQHDDDDDDDDDEDDDEDEDDVFENKNSPKLLVPSKSQLKKHDHTMNRLNNRRTLHYQNKLHGNANPVGQGYLNHHLHHHHHHHHAKKRINFSLSANAALSLTTSIDSFTKSTVNDQLVPRDQQQPVNK